MRNFLKIGEKKSMPIYGTNVSSTFRGVTLAVHLGGHA